jgi:hypothetical protein
VYACYNDSGLAVTNNAIILKEVNPAGMNGHHVIRMALEECGTLEEVEAIYGRYHEVAGSALIWSDGRQNQGLIFETSPPEKYSVVPLEESLLIQANMVLDQEFINSLESTFLSRSSFNLSRKRIIDHFVPKPAYAVRALLRTEGLDMFYIEKWVRELALHSIWEMVRP